MKNNALNISVTILGLIFLFAGVASIKYMAQIANELNSAYSVNKENPDPKYHFMIISNELNFSSGQAFIEGVHLACEEFNAVVEINEYKRENIDEQLRNIEIAIASKVDGIILQGTPDERFIEKVDKAIEMGIPVITIFDDVVKSRRLSFIGVNSYELGNIAAEMAAKAVAYTGDMAIIFDGVEEAQVNTSKNLMESGIREGLKHYPNINIKKIDTSKTGILGAGDITREIIRDFPSVNVIFSTNPTNTLGVTQAVIDMNKVGRVKIVGFGDDQEILTYIEKGIIDYSLVSDTKSIGYQCIESTIKHLENGSVSDFEDAEIYVIDNANIEGYRQSDTEAGEEF